MTTAERAFLFPGQGAQKVGMGRDWADAFEGSRRAFEEADEVLGFALSKLCFEGPEEELALTANTQPALLATSIAIHRAVTEAGLGAAVMAGHSLGEYSALVAAGSLGYADALRLVRRRGELMQEAVPIGEGGMAAIIGLEDDALEALIDEVRRDGEILTVANLNSPGQTVIAGHREPVERAAEQAKGKGAKKAVVLKVSAPFHSPLMAPARDGLAPLLAEVDFADPAVPVVTNVDATPATTGEAARDALVRQVDSPVRWVETIRWMAAERGLSSFVELGPSKVVAPLARRIADGVETVTLDTPDMLGKYLGQESG